MKAVYKILEKQSPDLESMEVVLEAIAGKYNTSAHYAMDFLVRLTHYYEEAEEAYLTCARYKQAKVRLIAVQCIFTYRPTGRVEDQVFLDGLKDKSKKVRQFTGDRIVAFDRTDMLPELELAAESDEALQRDRSLLKFGVVVTPDRGGKGLRVCVRDKNGGFVSGPPIPHEEFNRDSLKKEVIQKGGRPERLEGWTDDEILPSMY